VNKKVNEMVNAMVVRQLETPIGVTVHVDVTTREYDCVRVKNNIVRTSPDHSHYAQRLRRAADDDVGVQANTAQRANAVLRRLRFLLADRANDRHERHVDMAEVVCASLELQLSQRLEEHHRLDCVCSMHVDVVE
jgi:hypothetical protein